MDNIKTIIAAFVGSYAFSIIFHLRGKKLLWAGLGGGLTWMVYLLLSRCLSNVLLLYFIPSIFATAYAEIMARINKAPATCFLMPAEIPLIPGASLYYTMSAIVNSNTSEFYIHLQDTLYMALGIACGVVVCSVVFKYIHKVLNKYLSHI